MTKRKGGMDAYQRSPTPGWCFFCDRTHLFIYPCDALALYQQAPKRIRDRGRYVARAKVAGKTPSPRADDSIPSGGLEQGAPA